MGIANIIFIIILLAAIVVFTLQVRKIAGNINLGRDVDRSDQKSLRWKTMAKVAMGQSKMQRKPIAGILHFVVYAGFIIINIEVLEIIIDGVLGTHRAFSFMGGFYFFIINAFEVLALLVLLACVVFLIRRNILKIRRFHLKDMTKWPKSDANIILIVEILLMAAFLTMNAADTKLMNSSVEAAAAYSHTGMENPSFVISQFLTGIMPESIDSLIFVERFCWWFHIIGIFLFLNYLPISKHFHIILAFPNVFYSNLKPKGQFNNLESVKKEVEMMMDPDADPYAAPAPDENTVPQSFGAKDVKDLSWKNLMDAYSCTECGRCTSACPANQTGKLLSPRKIMMDTRDRLEEVGKNERKKGADYDDGKALLGDYITAEELWACTTCNACVQECPVNIDPLSIIVDLRRFLVMEKSEAPNELNMMFTNIENNGAPWQFPPVDRANWRDEL